MPPAPTEARTTIAPAPVTVSTLLIMVALPLTTLNVTGRPEFVVAESVTVELTARVLGGANTRTGAMVLTPPPLPPVPPPLGGGGGGGGTEPPLVTVSTRISLSEPA